MDMTAKLFECDRDEMYTYILRLCSKHLPFICLCALILFVFVLLTLSVLRSFNFLPLLARLCVTVWDQSEGRRRHVLIAAEQTDNNCDWCDWSVKADCQPITSTSLPTRSH